MADAVSSQTISDGDRIAVMKFTNLSDGTGESAVAKVTPSSLRVHSKNGKACSAVAVERIWYTTSGMSVQLLWDADTDDTMWILDGDNYLDFRSFGPLVDPQSTGYTGVIKFTTIGHSLNDSYSIVLELRKIY